MVLRPQLIYSLIKSISAIEKILGILYHIELLTSRKTLNLSAKRLRFFSHVLESCN